MNLKNNLDLINSKIEAACNHSGRRRSDVDLMLVTKTVPADRILQTIDIGYKLFGENKVQEAAEKWKTTGLNQIKPDFIGHLQTNKIKACLDTCDRIQSVDRLSLVEALDKELLKRGEQREVFLQVNSSGEASKYGVAVEDTLHFAKEVSRYSTLKVTGLMTLAMFSEDAEKIRDCFRKMKRLQASIQESGLFSEKFKHLSMGMSSDYELAIEEGATIVRVGTAIFGTRPTPDSIYWPEDVPKA